MKKEIIIFGTIIIIGIGIFFFAPITTIKQAITKSIPKVSLTIEKKPQVPKTNLAPHSMAIRPQAEATKTEAPGPAVDPLDKILNYLQKIVGIIASVYGINAIAKKKEVPTRKSKAKAK